MLDKCVCEGQGLVATIRADVDRYAFQSEREGRSRRAALPRIAVISPGLWALLAYRIAHFAINRLRPRPVGLLVGAVAFLVQRVLLAVTGVEIDTQAHLGAGLFIPHAGNVVIGAVRTGRNCTVSQGVTLGRTTLEENPLDSGTPRLGDRVWIGPGAVVAGALTVGDDAAVGANSVLLRDVPPRAVVLGIPARVVSWRGSFAQIAYRGMHEDPERLAAQQHEDRDGQVEAQRQQA